MRRDKKPAEPRKLRLAKETLRTLSSLTEDQLREVNGGWNDGGKTSNRCWRP